MVSKSEVKFYLLFAYEDYYPRGGGNDCRGVFDSEQAALECIKRQYPQLMWDNIDLCVIKDGQLEMLYHVFNVTGTNGGTQRVLGCDETKTIKLKAKEKKIATPRYYCNHFPSIDCYKDESA